MSIPRYFLLLTLFLTGCAGPHGEWPGFTLPRFGAGSEYGAGSSQGRASVAARYAVFNFDWQLSGDPQIMPVQVFDDGGRTWLQFQPESAWPAVFEAGAQGWRPLSYERDGPYMVLQGVHDRLELRGGHLQGVVQRGGSPVVSAPHSGGIVMVAEASVQPDAQDPAPAEPPAVQKVQAVPGTAAMAVALPARSAPPQAATVPGLAAGSVQAPSAPVLTLAAASAESAPVQPAVGRYAVSPADQTMRQALERWALRAGWTFSAEHWAVDVDIPLVGDASFDTDFKSAVRELLAATEMGDRPLQPCFYSNRVVRVVAYAQACDRRKGMGAMS